MHEQTTAPINMKTSRFLPSIRVVGKYSSWIYLSPYKDVFIIKKMLYHTNIKHGSFYANGPAYKKNGQEHSRDELRIGVNNKNKKVSKKEKNLRFLTSLVFPENPSFWRRKRIDFQGFAPEIYSFSFQNLGFSGKIKEVKNRWRFLSFLDTFLSIFLNFW